MAVQNRPKIHGRKPWFIKLTSRQADVLQHVKLFFIANSRIPTDQELANELGLSKNTGATFLRLFREVGIIKQASGRNNYRWVRVPYQIIDCGRVAAKRGD